MLQRFKLGKNKINSDLLCLLTFQFCPSILCNSGGRQGETTRIYQRGVMLYSAYMPLAVTSEDECQT